MLIPCSIHCAYQTDGYCHLQTVGAVTGSDVQACPHQTSIRPERVTLPPSERYITGEPQQLL